MKQITLVCLLFAAITFANTKDNKRPNIIFFLVDDLGYMDLGCYGSNFYETPNIDKLANEGIRFTNGYEAAPRCVSSRKSIMAGQYPFRPELQNLTAEHVTLAEALHENGYGTFFTGKWHLAHNEAEMPENQGFDVNVGGCHYGSPPTYWYPYGKGNKKPVPGLEGGKEGEYLTDRLTDETIKYMASQVKNNPNQPFLAYVSHYGVHTPLEGKPEYVKKYRAKLKTMEFSGPAFKNELTGVTKLHQDNAVYAAMIQSIDDSLGKLRASLETLGIADNTIIILTSDNGGLSTTEIGSKRAMATSNKPLKTGKGWLYEGGIRLPLIVYGPDFKGNRVEDTPVVGVDYYPTLLNMAKAPLKPEQHKDGVSFYPLLECKSFKRAPIIWDYDFAKIGTGNPSMAAVRDGDFKLVELKHTKTYELYNVKKDVGENDDLSAQYPDKVKEMKKMLFDFRTSIGISQEVTNKKFQATNKRLYKKMKESKQ
ncbi:hypothetical protein AXE80_00450 [Wenyingzhuangia fucanilytica]|uniref:Sulfatase N-terminal domain-containing protein n=1 Tax=Wenyingzhuangia fucanilytica TaxID=1790137 RepID=A0A1B1Y254_9FLAO|nr:sulfatase [Wenyingzhuangia fucanilytica]ANW94855.1 hypothetical protein AXE80_00450 [Wenyingzhuangia fucanilytica]